VPLSVILALCMGGIACCTPLTLYLFWLANLNRRGRPTPVAGPWDFVALLAGLSGFLVIGSGLLLTAVVARSRLWGGHSFEELRDSWGHERTAWAVALAAYLAAAGLLVGLTLAARRRSLVAYNADLPAAEAALGHVFDDLGLPVKRFGNLWTDADGRGLVEAVPFHLFRNVTFRLLTADPRLREELDRRLRAAVAARPAGDNPVAPWLATTAVSLFVTVLCCVVLIGAAVFAVR
jgi:hypothetical protein